jgi:hypothetical protein
MHDISGMTVIMLTHSQTDNAQSFTRQHITSQPLAQARASEKKAEKAESMEAEQDKSIFVTSCLYRVYQGVLPGSGDLSGDRW